MTRLTYRVHGTQRAATWRDEAACATTDPDAFFSKNSHDIPRVQAICARCPVRIQCAQFAIRTGQNWGVWGGMTQTELRRLRTRNADQDAA
jgi:WhiB family redox-sensing transcriptional regulator